MERRTDIILAVLDLASENGPGTVSMNQISGYSSVGKKSCNLMKNYIEEFCRVYAAKGAKENGKK